MMTWWQRFQRWRWQRLITKLVYASAEVMLDLAAQQFRDALTGREKAKLVRRYGRWLSADQDRMYALIEQPARTLHLFLSDVIR